MPLLVLLVWVLRKAALSRSIRKSMLPVRLPSFFIRKRIVLLNSVERMQRFFSFPMVSKSEGTELVPEARVPSLIKWRRYSMFQLPKGMLLQARQNVFIQLHLVVAFLQNRMSSLFLTKALRRKISLSLFFTLSLIRPLLAFAKDVKLKETSGI